MPDAPKFTAKAVATPEEAQPVNHFLIVQSTDPNFPWIVVDRVEDEYVAT